MVVIRGALKNINWTVNKNEHWAILGLNGSGKSSLLKLIMAENWKTTGELTVLDTRFGIAASQNSAPKLVLSAPSSQNDLDPTSSPKTSS